MHNNQMEVSKEPSTKSMACNCNLGSSSSLPTTSLRALERSLTKNHVTVGKPTTLKRNLLPRKAIPSEGITEESNSTGSSARAQLDLLKQLTSPTEDNGYESEGNAPRPTIREQLSQLIGDREGEYTLPLGKKLKASVNSLTISQKRNIKRQSYLDEVGRRNDSVFFATIGAFVILPPVVILSVAILTGYVQLFP